MRSPQTYSFVVCHDSIGAFRIENDLEIIGKPTNLSVVRLDLIHEGSAII